MVTRGLLYRSGVAGSNVKASNASMAIEVKTDCSPSGPRINLVATTFTGGRETNRAKEQYVLSMDEKQVVDLIGKLAKELEVLRAELADKWMTY